jgi:hypothetical protein
MRAESPAPSLALSPFLVTPRQQEWGRAFSPAIFCGTETLGVAQGWFEAAPLALTSIAVVFKVAQGWYDVAPLALGEDGLEARATAEDRPKARPTQPHGLDARATPFFLLSSLSLSFSSERLFSQDARREKE